MAEQNKNKNSEQRFQFLLNEHDFAANERWKYAEHSWEVFKFYMTLLTGASGFIIALGTGNLNLHSLLLAISITSTIISIVGLTIFMQLLRLDSQFQGVRRKIGIRWIRVFRVEKGSK